MFSPLYLVSGVLGLLSNVLIAVAISLDCKARNIKSRVAYSVLAFFFPLIVGIVYACTRKTAQKINNEPVANASKLAKNSVIVFVIAVIAFVGSAGVSVYSSVSGAVDLLDSVSDTEYYDMKSNQYDDYYDVIYYDIDLNEYKYDVDEDTYDGYFVNQSTNEKLLADKCYIDEQGYLFYDENDELVASDDYTTFTDSQGNTYYFATDVYWNSSGDMVDWPDNSLK
jgi:hypothetical protein